jgi:hypothetical protein
MFSVLATGPKSRGFKPDRGDGFLRAIKIRSTSSFGWKMKPEVPCRKILQHVKHHMQVWTEILCKGKFSHLSLIPPACYQMTVLVGFLESSGGWLRRPQYRDTYLTPLTRSPSWCKPKSQNGVTMVTVITTYTVQIVFLKWSQTSRCLLYKYILIYTYCKKHAGNNIAVKFETLPTYALNVKK